MEFDELASINSELRFITIELMKLSAQRGISFEEALAEFLQNTSTLRNSIRADSTPRASRVASGVAAPRQLKARK